MEIRQFFADLTPPPSLTVAKFLERSLPTPILRQTRTKLQHPAIPNNPARAIARSLSTNSPLCFDDMDDSV